MNHYTLKKDLVKGYNIGLQNDELYFPVPDRNVLSFKKYEGEIEVRTIDGQIMIIKDWKHRIIEETFDDHYGRGKYKIGYFLFRPLTEEDRLKRFSEQCL